MRRSVILISAVLVILAGALAAPAAAQGSDDGDEAVSSPDERAQREAGLELLSYVPGSYDQRCRIQTDEDIAGDSFLTRAVTANALDLEAFLVCPTDDDAILLDAFKFDSSKFDGGTAEDVFYDAYTPEGIDPSTPGCESDGTWDDGRVKCYLTEGGGSAIVWTFKPAGALFAAFRDNRDIDALRQWWEDSGPPIDEPPAPAKLVSDAAWVENGRLLRKSVPKDFRDTCSTPAISADELGDLYRDRLTLRTVLYCDPGAGIDAYVVVDFQFRENAKSYVDAYAEFVDEGTPQAASGGTDCEGSGTWSRGSGGKVAGEYACYFPDRGGVAIVWSDKKQGIALSARRDDGDAEKLLAFYTKRAGPVANPGLS